MIEGGEAYLPTMEQIALICGDNASLYVEGLRKGRRMLVPDRDSFKVGEQLYHLPRDLMRKLVHAGEVEYISFELYQALNRALPKKKKAAA